MVFACSLYRHPQGYHLSCTQALQSSLLSPFAQRHLDLANASQATCTQRWGHRVIAAIQFIPVVGLLASLIERIVCLVFRLILGSQHVAKNEIEAKQSAPLEPPQPQVLAVPPSAPPQPAPVVASAPAADPIPTVAPIQSVVLFQPDPRYAAKVLIDFCKQIPSCATQLRSVAHLGEIESAEEMRKWMKQNADIASMPELILCKRKLWAIPPEISCFKMLKRLSLAENQISSLPPEIGQLSELTNLILHKNYLRALPLEIGNLSKLSFLNICENLLDAYPTAIEALPASCRIVCTDSIHFRFPPNHHRGLQLMNFLEID